MCDKSSIPLARFVPILNAKKYAVLGLVVAFLSTYAIMCVQHWSRDDKNRCLKEATKSFRYMGQIVRLIIL